MYTIFGDASNDMVIPAGYQEVAPFGANTGGVNAAFVSVSPTAAFDSWLSVGITDGDASGALGSVGIDFSAWTDTAGATINNGAVFWMAPTDGPAGKAVVAQITTSGDFDAVINAQGRSSGGADDWQARGIAFSSTGGGGGAAAGGGRQRAAAEAPPRGPPRPGCAGCRGSSSHEVATYPYP